MGGGGTYRVFMGRCNILSGMIGNTFGSKKIDITNVFGDSLSINTYFEIITKCFY